MAVRVLSFYQEGCMGCEEQTPILREVESDLGITIEEIDAVKNPQYIKEYNLRVTPTTLVIADDGVRERMEGLVHREDLEAAIRRHIPEPLPR
jgi:thioredoxin 1